MAVCLWEDSRKRPKTEMVFLARGWGGMGNESTVRQGCANLAFDLVPKNLIFAAYKSILQAIILQLPIH